MKKILFLLLFAGSLKAQINWTLDSTRCFPIYSEAVKIDLKGNVYVKGDSLHAIKILFAFIAEETKRYHKLDSMQLLYKNLANASIDLINDIPTYYKTNSCFWENYIRNVKLNGLTFCKIKPYQFKPCNKKH